MITLEKKGLKLHLQYTCTKEGVNSRPPPSMLKAKSITTWLIALRKKSRRRSVVFVIRPVTEYHGHERIRAKRWSVVKGPGHIYPAWKKVSESEKRGWFLVPRHIDKVSDLQWKKGPEDGYRSLFVPLTQIYAGGEGGRSRKKNKTKILTLPSPPPYSSSALFVCCFDGFLWSISLYIEKDIMIHGMYT